MSFWKKLTKLQPGKFLRKNVGGAIGKAARDVNKNRVFRAVTAPQRVLLGAGLSVVAPKLAKRTLSLSDSELKISRAVGIGAAVVGGAILAPAAVGTLAKVAISQKLFRKPAPEESMSPPFYPSDANETLSDQSQAWESAGTPSAAPEPLPAADPRPMVGATPAELAARMAPLPPSAQGEDWLLGLMRRVWAFFGGA